MSDTKYDESKIQTLSPLEHIRLRSGMYIGRLGDGSDTDDGIYVLIKEVIDNSIDEFIMGHGSRITVDVADKRVVIRDFGRGIPLGKVIDCVSVINTGAKYNDDVFQFSVGLNGVGTKAVNALSQYFRVRSHREGMYKEAIFERGKLVSETTGKTTEADGTLTEFIPDDEIFGKYEFNAEFLDDRMRNYCYLNKGIKLYYNSVKFESKTGLLDLLEAKTGGKTLYPILHYVGKQMEFSLTHIEHYGETYFSFVNGQYTSDGGTHLSAFREGFLRGINDFFKKSYSGLDVREGATAAIAIKVKDPVFESQTKNKLGNTDIRSGIIEEVRAAIADFLHKNKELSQLLEQRIIQNEKLRKELNSVRKEAREKSKRISFNIPNLKDCKFHYGDEKKEKDCMIFITEGQSATGSIVSSRDAKYQAIYSLRGKPWNCYGKSKADIYQNEELYNLMMSLGIEQQVESIRYDKVIIATDADTDGFHIRNLVMTFFLHYFEELVVNGHLYILETPLFRVRNKQKSIYCYNEDERDKAVAQLKTAVEVTRFKGLGEISPSEFKQFIDEGMRIIPITLGSLQEVPRLLEFYMGKNTPSRRDYIMENLI